MRRYKLIVAYDGTHFFGWQKTKEGPSIQETLQKAILSVSSEAPLPEAASRTDRGVHAREQVVSFPLKKLFDPPILLRALNAHLPKEIRVLFIEEKEASFHPTLDALGKIYHYHIFQGVAFLPKDRLYSWHIPFPLDVEEMRKGAHLLLGTHDFSAFSTRLVPDHKNFKRNLRPDFSAQQSAELEGNLHQVVKSERKAGQEKMGQTPENFCGRVLEKNPICTLHSLAIVEEGPNIKIVMEGDRFLYKMARAIAGTLVYVGQHKIDVEKIVDILAEKKRRAAGMTAPAHGLFLHKVLYPC